MNSKEVLKRIEEELYLLLPKGIRQELIETINQDLDRLEQLEKENQELKEHSTELFDRCALLTLKVEQLKQANQNLKEVMKNREEGTIELIKAIKILKDNFPIKFLGYNKYGAKPYEIIFNGFITGFDKEAYELLKRVFESVGGENAKD